MKLGYLSDRGFVPSSPAREQCRVVQRQSQRTPRRRPKPSGLHVKKICGDPPPEMKLEIVWQEHELGNYPTIGLVRDDPMRGTPWNYISRCEAALTAFENGGELPSGWTMPPGRSEDELTSLSIQISRHQSRQKSSTF